MPKIAQYEPNQISTRVVNQPFAQDAPADAFGGPVVEGALNLARAGLDIKKRIDTTSAEESLISFERDKNDLFFNPKSGYFNTQGRNAFDGSVEASKALDELKVKYGKGLGQQAKLMFDKAADTHVTRGRLDITKHSSKGLKAWEIGTIESQVENTIENASLYWNDPNRLKVQNILGRQAIFDSAKLMGFGFEETAEKVQTYESMFARASIEAATKSSAVEGKIALEQYGSKLEGPDKIKIDGIIKAKVKVDKTQSDAVAAVATASKLIDQNDNRKDIVEEVNKITDDDLRKKTMNEAMSQFSRNKQAQSEQRAASFEDAEGHILQGGSAESYKINNPEDWETLSEKQKRSIESGVVSTTDWNVFSDLMLLPKTKLAKVDPTDHFDKLAKGERSKLISAVKSANGTGSSKDRIDHQVGRTRSAQTTAAIETLVGKKSKWNDKKREQANGFYSLLDDEVAFRESEKGSKLTSEEYTNLVSGLTRKVVQEGFFFDSTLDIGDIPTDDIPTLSKFLRDNNVPITSDNLLKAFKQASE